MSDDVLQDLVLECADCHDTFIVTPGEQALLRRKQLHVPKRCADCREIRRERFRLAERESTGRRGLLGVRGTPRYTTSNWAALMGSDARRSFGE